MQVLVAGVAVRLEASSPTELLDLRASLAPAPYTDEPPTLVLRSAKGTLPQPTRSPDRVTQHVRYWDDESTSVLLAPGPGSRARVSTGCAVLDPGDGGVPAIHALLLPVLALLVAQQGGYLVHGGAFLLGPAGGAVLALGGSGRGKSTLIATALEKGLPVLTDDLMVLRLRNGEAFVSGVPQPLALPAELAHLTVAGEAIPGDPRRRREAVAGVALATGDHRVEVVLLVEHSDRAEGHLRRAEGRDVLRGLLASTLEGLAPSSARDVFPYAAAVARVPAWHFGHAADANRRVPAALARLDELRCVGAAGRVDALRG